MSFRTPTVKLLTHSVAALSGHQGPARNDARARRLAERLVTGAPYVTTKSGTGQVHAPGFVNSMTSAQGGQHLVFDAEVIDGLVYAYKARKDLPHESLNHPMNVDSAEYANIVLELHALLQPGPARRDGAAAGRAQAADRAVDRARAGRLLDARRLHELGLRPRLQPLAPGQEARADAAGADRHRLDPGAAPRRPLGPLVEVHARPRLRALRPHRGARRRHRRPAVLQRQRRSAGRLQRTAGRRPHAGQRRPRDRGRAGPHRRLAPAGALRL